MKRYIFTVIYILLLPFLNFNCQKPNASQRTDSSSVTILYPWDERVLAPYYDVDAYKEISKEEAGKYKKG